MIGRFELDSNPEKCYLLSQDNPSEEKDMLKERFSKILKEYDFTDRQIELLWNSKPAEDLDERKLRETAEHLAPIKDRLVQA